MKLGLYYFSGTGVTGQFASRMVGRFNHKGIETAQKGITALKYRKLDLENFDGYIFGFPVYGGVSPTVTREWMKTLQGKGKPCAMFFTYGGVTMGFAHYHTKQILEQQGFQVIGSAEFPGRHTFNVAKGFEFIPERPDDNDFAVADDYVDKLIKKFSAEKITKITFEKPEKYDEYIERNKNRKKSPARIVPSRNGKECQLCGDCEEYCATGAFNHETGEADPMLCISCLYCKTICRDQVIDLNADMTEICKNLTEHYKLTDEVLGNLKSTYFI